MNYNPELHHRRSIRLKGYDYSQEGAYFITLCVRGRENLFGKVANGKMILSEAGKIAYDEWFKTPELRKNIELDAFIVMPNHLHGIIIIKEAYRKGEDTDTSKGEERDTDTGKGELHSPKDDLQEKDMWGDTDTSKGELHSPKDDIEKGDLQYMGVSGDRDMGVSEDRDMGFFGDKEKGVSGDTDTSKGELHSPKDDIEKDDLQEKGVSGDKEKGVSGDKEKGECNSPQPPQRLQPPRFISPSQTIGSIIRGYKSAVTKKIYSKDEDIDQCEDTGKGEGTSKGELYSPKDDAPKDTIWQRNYYEHIIRDQQAYENISNYIINNPAKWKGDKFFEE